MGTIFTRVKETELQPHGPRIDTILIDPPPFMIAFWIIGLISLLASIIIFWKHSTRLYSMPSTDLRDYYMKIIAFPLVLCGSSVLNLFFARPSVLWTLMQRMYEAIALVAFRQLLLRLLGRDIKKVAERLRSGPKVHIYSAPPLLCCLRPFTKPSYATARIIRWSCACVTQFAYVIPGMGFIHLWIMVDGFMGQPINVGAASSTVSILSMCLAMQGLITLYLVSRHFLKEYHPGKKFLAIKIIVILATAQTFIIRACVPLHYDVEQYDRKAFIDIIGSFILAIESTFLGFLMTKAFPEEELKIHSNATIRQYLEGQVEFDRITTLDEERGLANEMLPSDNSSYDLYDGKQTTTNGKKIDMTQYSTPSQTSVRLTTKLGNTSSETQLTRLDGRRNSYGGTESESVISQDIGQTDKMED